MMSSQFSPQIQSLLVQIQQCDMHKARDKSNIFELVLQGLWDIFNAKTKNSLHSEGAVCITFELSINDSVCITTELLYCEA